MAGGIHPTIPSLLLSSRYLSVDRIQCRCSRLGNRSRTWQRVKANHIQQASQHWHRSLLPSYLTGNSNSINFLIALKFALTNNSEIFAGFRAIYEAEEGAQVQCLLECVPPLCRVHCHSVGYLQCVQRPQSAS